MFRGPYMSILCVREKKDFVETLNPVLSFFKNIFLLVLHRVQKLLPVTGP